MDQGGWHLKLGAGISNWGLAFSTGGWYWRLAFGSGAEIWNWRLRFGTGAGIWNWELILGASIWNWDLELGAGTENWKLGLVGIGDWDLKLGAGTGGFDLATITRLYKHELIIERLRTREYSDSTIFGNIEQYLLISHLPIKLISTISTADRGQI